MPLWPPHTVSMVSPASLYTWRGTIGGGGARPSSTIPPSSRDDRRPLLAGIGLDGRLPPPPPIVTRRCTSRRETPSRPCAEATTASRRVSRWRSRSSWSGVDAAVAVRGHHLGQRGGILGLYPQKAPIPAGQRRRCRAHDPALKKTIALDDLHADPTTASGRLACQGYR